MGQPITNKEAIQGVQQKLLKLGYVGVGEPDGLMGKKTEASILNFRNRQHPPLPLLPYVDEELLKAIDIAPPIVLPVEQTTATAQDIAPKVEALRATKEASKTNWRSKVLAWVLAVPSLLAALGTEIVKFIASAIDQTGPAIQIFSPLRSLFSEIPWQAWLGSFGLTVLVFAILSQKAQGHSDKADTAMVDGFQKGTVRNDLKTEDDRP